jgi:predicted MFS family arabinose efflux permease
VAGRHTVGVALGLLFAVNLLNYIDRYVIASLLPPIKAEFGVSDAQLGLLPFAFLLVYTAVSPLVGLAADRIPRKGLVAGGIALWSLATAGAAAAGSYGELFLTRALVGVGEASFGTIGPVWIADLVPRERRARALTTFYIATPVGSALGYLLGGLVGARLGWRAAFLVAGVPGVLLALGVLALREPARGATEVEGPSGRRPGRADYAALFRTRSYLYNVAGSTLYTFAIGGLSYWMPTFLVRVHGVPLDQAGFGMGLVVVLGGLLGVVAGGWLGDRAQARTASGHFLVSGWGMVAGTPFAVLAFVSHSLPVVYGAVFLAVVLLFLNTGPLNAVLTTVTRPEVRATAVAVHIFVIHALGDVLSPPLIGALSDESGLRTAVLVTTPVAMAAGGLVILAGARSLASDLSRLARAPA